MIACVRCGREVCGLPSYLEGIPMVCRSCDKPGPAPKDTDNPYDRRFGPKRAPRKCTCGAKFEPESPAQKYCRLCQQLPRPKRARPNTEAFVEALLSHTEE